MFKYLQRIWQQQQYLLVLSSSSSRVVTLDCSPNHETCSLEDEAELPDVTASAGPIREQSEQRRPMRGRDTMSSGGGWGSEVSMESMRPGSKYHSQYSAFTVRITSLPGSYHYNSFLSFKIERSSEFVTKITKIHPEEALICKDLPWFSVKSWGKVGVGHVDQSLVWMVSYDWSGEADKCLLENISLKIIYN